MDEVRELVPDKPLDTPLVHEIMRALEGRSEASYRVWLLLSKQYGTGLRECQ